MDINLEHYKTFCVVAESISITEAANKLNISQPAVTKTIRNIEQELNNTLFIRKHNGIYLTKEGEKLYAYIKPIILQLEDSKNIMNQMIQNQKTEIRIGTSTTVLKLFLLDYIKEYTEKYPNINIYIEDNTNSNLISKIKEGAIDIAIIITSKKYLENNYNITLQKIKELKYGLYASKKYIIVNKVTSLEELKEKNFIVNINTTEINKIYNNYNIKNVISVASNAFIQEFIQANMGIGLLIKDFTKKINNIKEIKTKDKLPKTNLVIITNNNKYHNVAISLFVKGIKKLEDNN